VTSIDHDKSGRVFVYGSLKRGKQLYFIEELTALRQEVLPARLHNAVLYDLGPYPGMLIKPGGGFVLGEVHRFRPMSEAMAILDDVEEYYGEGDPNNLYRRVELEAELLNGNGFIACWAYEYVGSLQGASVIESGVWNGAAVQRQRKRLKS
jgi:gamma-glutamylcyclotransferase (GGCT)/AIG2-like uncharacterized protein YtfP